ncbi:MAG: protein translocase subunit SecD [Candidatus Pacebacteria bacterium]|nr:protein translocase subunit SecD [Candidatus Paceibacterota bacterium]MCD8508330.1 protein translocase subunit SecD [Candidatus Paceibacterota bacterium]MCD8527879.1 protein translocase subunit SecD [Candidatus Paceibacterota bacterium]MCD8564007.1 protein translocase subunit SecD [Candidatus Paceibacterota bacterium]
MVYQRIIASVLLIIGLGVGYFVASTQESRPFQLGLDLSGGTHLEYDADISALPEDSVRESLQSLRDVIERRINLFGVSEPNIQTETVRLGQDGVQHRLIVELPGITDIDEAVRLIGETPVLEFKLMNENGGEISLSAADISEDGVLTIGSALDSLYTDTGLTGRYLSRARLDFAQGSVGVGAPIVALTFDREGADLFAEITRNNVGRVLAIFLDGEIISAPVIQTAITGGEAIITGTFDLDEAKALVGRLNAGALPVPIELAATESVGPTLGDEAARAGVFAGMVGLLAVIIFLIAYYRFPGLIAALALLIYGAVMLALFKLIPVTLTAAGIAGFIISLGIAVDANILIFERMKEELRDGRTTQDAITAGFDRAWLSIRDGNISSIISAIILFWFGTSLIKGFALTFGIGVLVSMFTAITATRYFLLATSGIGETRIGRFLFSSGIDA